MEDKNYICLFKVVYLNEGVEVEDCGFCFANDFAEAVNYLERHLYGDELLYITHMELIETCPTLPKDLWQALRKELNEN